MFEIFNPFLHFILEQIAVSKNKRKCRNFKELRLIFGSGSWTRTSDIRINSHPATPKNRAQHRRNLRFLAYNTSYLYATVSHCSMEYQSISRNTKLFVISAYILSLISAPKSTHISYQISSPIVSLFSAMIPPCFLKKHLDIFRFF